MPNPLTRAVQSGLNWARRRRDLQIVERAFGGRGRRDYYGVSSLMSGGLVNQKTGMGTSLDKSEDSVFLPTRIYSREPLEILCVQSWAAKKFVRIPVDDMFIRWRACMDDDESAKEAVEMAERELKGLDALRNAMIAARQYGTGVVVPMLMDAAPDEPLMLDRIKEGDLKSFLYLDRYDIDVVERNHDPYSPTYGEPLMYSATPPYNAPFRIHASRVIRFDGQRPPTKSGFTYYNQDFGESELIPIIGDIMRATQLSSGISHMTQEASIPILHIEGLRETIAGLNPTDVTPSEIGMQINAAKSMYRIMMLDHKSREEFNRVAVNFAGLADLVDRSYSTLAAAADIPQTRFLGNPPTGMSATGESDMRNYVAMLEANREKMLRDPLYLYDQIIAKHCGLAEPLEYEWQSLIELGDKERAETSKIKVDALVAAVGSSMVDEDEARDSLRGDWLFGELEGDAPEPLDMDMDGGFGVGMNGNGSGGSQPNGG